jgi:hypothetical protein
MIRCFSLHLNGALSDMRSPHNVAHSVSERQGGRGLRDFAVGTRIGLQ